MELIKGAISVAFSCLKPVLDPESDITCGHTTESSENYVVNSVDTVVCEEISVTVSEESETDTHCMYCGASAHDRSVCPARHERCTFCRIPGHFRSVCRRLTRLSPPHFVSAAVLGSISDKSSLAKSIVPVLVNGHKFRALIDTGSSLSFIDQKLVRSLHLPKFSQNVNIALAASNAGATSSESTVLQELQLCGHTHKNQQISVLPQLCCDLIIGLDLLSSYQKLVMNFDGPDEDFIVDTGTSKTSHNCNNLDTEPDFVSFPDVFCNVAAADIESPPLFSNLSDDCHPIACKSRRYNPEDTLFIRQEVAKLLQAGIIEHSNSPWRAQVLVTKDERHKRRMVIDYSRTINKFTFLDAYPLPRLDDMAFQVSRCKLYSCFDLKSAYHQISLLAHEKHFTAFEADGGLYQCTRVPFGVKNGPSAFQRTMMQLIRRHDLRKTWVYLDNVTIGGDTQEEHDQNVFRFRELFVKKYGLTLNEDKTISSVQQIQMLGYLISHMQVRPDPDRMAPLLNLPIPSDLKALNRARGLFSYYSQWIPKFSDKIKPLTANHACRK